MAKSIGIIGSTGFVGGNLVAQVGPADGYNSKNIEEIDGKEYDLLFCAGARAEMWRINQDPETDRANNRHLMQNMAKAKVKHLVLISTVGVYPAPIVDVNEDTVIDESNLPPYGVHHLELERFCQDNFDTTIVRLPGLFGQGIKKNIVYDLLHDNNLDQIHADSVYQFYYLSHLWADIQKVMAKSLPLVNFATEPVSVAEVAQAAFGIEFTNRPAGKTPAFFDFRTKYSEELGGRSGYMTSKADELAQLAEFVKIERAKQ
jgi:nucleoside-diphosphate-sugar epimerase